ncbi:MAG: hypothetical protein M1829_003090 [Trizodia sp. TS-e1964]|nr:MAG: hypothetical protein M1829_003090 [Trizodia sp. TS-e1964]
MAAADIKGDWYVSEDDVGRDDGREIELLHFIYRHPNLANMRGSPAAVLDAIDEYGRTKNFLMNVGKHKGKIITDLIERVKPEVMVELGAYVGYSAILFGSAIQRVRQGQSSPPVQFFSLERNPEFGAVVLSLVDLAGLSGIVKVVVGPSDESLRRLQSEGILKHIDLLFIDHYKPAYVTDLKLCEELALIKPGSTIAADNVISPGNPPYLEYVRSSVEEKQRRFDKGSESGKDHREAFPQKTRDAYLVREGDDKPNTEIKGNPRLVYESQLINSFEPTGIPVSSTQLPN